jgi:hypothetical protein
VLQSCVFKKVNVACAGDTVGFRDGDVVGSDVNGEVDGSAVTGLEEG